MFCGCLGLARPAKGGPVKESPLKDSPANTPEDMMECCCHWTRADVTGGMRRQLRRKHGGPHGYLLHEIKRVLDGVPEEDVAFRIACGTDREILPVEMWGYDFNGTATITIEVKGGAQDRSCSVCEASEAPLTGFVGPPAEHVHDSDYGRLAFVCKPEVKYTGATRQQRRLTEQYVARWVQIQEERRIRGRNHETT